MQNKGFVTWFLNMTKDSNPINMSIDEYVEVVRRHNQASIDSLLKDGYVSIFVPCHNEACRVELTDFIKPEELETEEE